MSKKSMSISAGARAGRRHNIEYEYRWNLDHVDKNRTQYNEILVDRSIEKTYHDLFDKAVDRYNEKQSRSDRKIDNYLAKMRADKQQQEAYELVVQIGDRDSNSALDEGNRIGSSVVYREFMEAFEKKFPNFKIYQAVVHQDEATPHLHVAYVPFSEGNKRGLETKVSHSGALKAMGYSDVRDANKAMFDVLEKCASKHGIERLDIGCNRAHIDVRDYKKMAEEIENDAYKYNDNPLLKKLICEQKKVIEEYEELTNKHEIVIENLIHKCETASLGSYRETLQEIARDAIEVSKTLNPKHLAIKERSEGLIKAFKAIPEYWRENILNPVKERLNDLINPQRSEEPKEKAETTFDLIGEGKNALQAANAQLDISSPRRDISR